MKLPDLPSLFESLSGGRHPFACLCMLSILCLCTTGCGGDSQSDEERLLRKQRLRQAQSAGQGLSHSQRLEQAERELELGNYQNVLDLVRRMPKEQADDPQLILITAQALAKSGEIESATDVCGRLTPDNPEIFVDGNRLASSWNADRGDYDTAITTLQRIFDADLAQLKDRHEMAGLLNNAGRRIEAAQMLRPILRQGGLSERELFSLITLGSPFIDSSRPKPRIGAVPMPSALAEARVAREDDDAKALPMAAVLARTYPKSRQLFAFHARLLAERQQWEQLRTALANPPEQVDKESEFWFAVGLLSQHLEQHRVAVRCFMEALRIDPTDRFSYLYLGRSLSAAGQQDEAEHAFTQNRRLTETSSLIRKIGLAPGTEAQLNQLADLLEKLDRPYEAIAWRRIAIANHGGDRQALSDLSDRLERLRSGPEPEALATLGLQIGDWPLPDWESYQSLPDGPSAPEQTGSTEIAFEEVAESLGLSFQYVNRIKESGEPLILYIYHLNGGGIGVLDFDRDGWPDVYFAQSGGPPHQSDGSLPNDLFRNLNGKQFSSVGSLSETADLGFGQGVNVADLNQDGWPDLLVANIGESIWYQNQGDGTFVRHSLADSEARNGWTTSIACGDLNGDHLPEIVLANYTNDEVAFTLPCDVGGEFCSPLRMAPAHNQILTLGVTGAISNWNRGLPDDIPNGHSFAAVVTNINDQPGNELLILNDGDTNAYWLQSRPLEDDQPSENSFALQESGQLFGLATGVRGNRQGCMGVAAADLDGNGQIDFHVTNYWDQPSDLYLQQPGGFFQNGTMARGLGESSLKTVGWGTTAADLNHDGWPDLTVLNGHVVDYKDISKPYRMLPQLFVGGPKGFEPPPAPAGPYWKTPALGRTLAKLDFDRDGQIDLLAGHLDRPIALLHNSSDSGRWIQISLVGVTSERDAIGARVVAEANGKRQTAWVTGGDGFQSHSEAVLDFGFGAPIQGGDDFATIEIHWPSGKTQRVTGLSLEQRYRVIEDQSAFSMSDVGP